MPPTRLSVLTLAMEALHCGMDDDMTALFVTVILTAVCMVAIFFVFDFLGLGFP